MAWTVVSFLLQETQTLLPSCMTVGRPHPCSKSECPYPKRNMSITSPSWQTEWLECVEASRGVKFLLFWYLGCALRIHTPATPTPAPIPTLKSLEEVYRMPYFPEALQFENP